MPSYPPKRFTGDVIVSTYRPDVPSQDQELYIEPINSASFDVNVIGTSQSFNDFADTFEEDPDDTSGSGVASVRNIRGSTPRTASFLAYQASIQSK